MATFGTMKFRLDLLIQSHLDQPDVGELINRVHQEEVEAHAWAFRRTNTVLTTTALYSTGTISIVSGSNVVTGVGTTWTPAMTGSVMRVSNDDAYFAFTYVSATSGTLEVPYTGVTQTNAGYTLFPLLYTIVGADQILSINRQIPLEETTVEELNRIDPSRRNTGSPSTRWAPHGRSAAGYAQFELWPIETANDAYTVEYLAGHVDMVNPMDQPKVPGAVIENKCLLDAAFTMCARNGDQRWFKLVDIYQKRYDMEREKAIEADRKRYGTIHQVQDAYAGTGRVGVDYLMNHDTL